jgi:pSer/pThr/pTyr-binding forkhead associated (FHA) protein
MILRLTSTDPTLIDAPGYLVAGGTYKVGRIKSCEFVIKNLSVSREHAEVTVDAHTITIKDLKSLNGTFVDGERVGEVTLKPGQSVRFGSVLFHLVGQLTPGDEGDSDQSTYSIPLNSTSEMPALTQLSEAQRRVLDLLLGGGSEKQVAAKLDLSPHTVHNHIKEIYRRFGVSSRAELLALFVSDSKLPKKPEK